MIQSDTVNDSMQCNFKHKPLASTYTTKAGSAPSQHSDLCLTRQIVRYKSSSSRSTVSNWDYSICNSRWFDLYWNDFSIKLQNWNISVWLVLRNLT